MTTPKRKKRLIQMRPCKLCGVLVFTNQGKAHRKTSRCLRAKYAAQARGMYALDNADQIRLAKRIPLITKVIPVPVLGAAPAGTFDKRTFIFELWALHVMREALPSRQEALIRFILSAPELQQAYETVARYGYNAATRWIRALDAREATRAA